ncbi:hypothetical protein [Haliangium ochraceum]|uniref:Uncharacterized protein n=1 Tax=Haliangium ochraceum (strain DSM 14365 / JCM 11303 / SMP-2) TaxID=502025 RepID=D0LVX1_HALO1|nr:hypothetical protein [Haliangium ochraceum]ACY14105.1 hypothetical protein Hoch_1553 [Haliangium ochraceum DSM 14365]
MFDLVLELLVATLRRVNTLRYIRNIDVDLVSVPDPDDVYVMGADPEIGDYGELHLPVNAPEQSPTATEDYRPLPDQPLVLRLRPRIVIPQPSNDKYEPILVTVACIHALCFTDGELTEFMSQEHDLPPSQTGASGFMWATYKLDTLKVLSVEPIVEPEGMEIQLLFEGMILLHPPTAPAPLPIDEILPPAEPPPPASEIPRGMDEIVRVIEAGGDEP